MPVGGPARQAEGLGRLGLRQPGEESQGNQAGAEGIFPAQVRERLVEVDQVVAGSVERHGAQVEVDAPQSPAALEPAPVTAGSSSEDAAVRSLIALLGGFTVAAPTDDRVEL